MPDTIILLTVAGLMTGIAQLFYKKLSLTGHRATTYTTTIMLINGLLALPLLFYQFHLPSFLLIWALTLISVIVFAFSTFFGFLAYQHSDVSTISILQRLNIVFVALIGIIFLQETYTPQSTLGLLLIFLGGVLMVVEKWHFKLNLGAIYTILMAATSSIVTLLDKIILTDFSPFTYACINSLLVGLVFAFIPGNLKAATDLVRRQFKLLLPTSLLTIASFVLILLVLQHANISQTIPIYKSLQLLTPVILGIILFKEVDNLPQKLAATTIGLAGMVLLY